MAEIRGRCEEGKMMGRDHTRKAGACDIPGTTSAVTQEDTGESLKDLKWREVRTHFILETPLHVVQKKD